MNSPVDTPVRTDLAGTVYTAALEGVAAAEPDVAAVGQRFYAGCELVDRGESLAAGHARARFGAALPPNRDQ